MEVHVKILGLLHVVLGVLTLFGGLALWVLVGGVAQWLGLEGHLDWEALQGLPVVQLVGVVILAIAAILAIPSIVTGAGLLAFRPWARILGIVLSALHLVNVPLGTALGIYGLWVLLSTESEYLFHPPTAARAAKGYTANR